MTTLDDPPRGLCGNTPLRPQHYAKIAFLTVGRLKQQIATTVHDGGGCGGVSGSPLRNDPLHCLGVLYRTLIEPIEAHMTHMEPGNHNSKMTNKKHQR